MIGRSLGHCRIETEIGRGGMGVVYRARDEHLGRDVAVKVLPAGFVADEIARKRFRQEALLVSRLNHPNIQVVYDFDTQDGVDFLVSEYIPGESLDVRVARGPLEEKELLRLGAQLAHGLQTAHEKGLIHRDLKPSNLRVTPQGQLKILDFGLAKLLATSPDVVPLTTTLELLTQDGAIAGTLPYMSPEQLRGEPLDARSDLYSAGVVLYELATGKRPFAGETQPVLMNAILSHPPAPPTHMNRKVSDRLEQVILKALEKDRELRYQTARDLAIDLERLASPTQPVALPSRSRSQRRLPLAAGGVVLVGVIMSLVLLCRPPQGEALDSIAVLPFENVGGNPDLEYLSDGIAESLTNTLSQLPSLKKVIAWGSIRQLRSESGEKTLNPRSAGKALGVKTLLLGQVTSQGATLGVKAELMQVNGNRHLWGDQYNGTVADVFTMERRLADEITEGLRIHLSSSNAGAPMKPAPHQPIPAAYQLYLQGRYHLYKWSFEEINTAIGLFQNSIETDPQFALPYAGLAEAYYGLDNLYAPPREIMPKMRNAALQALAIDSTLVEARLALANVKLLFDWDWHGAGRDYKRSVEASPGMAQAQLFYGYYFVLLGHFSEAEPFLNRAKDLDPFQDLARGMATYPAFYSRDYKRAISELSDWVKTNPPSPYPFQLLGEAYEFNGQLREALIELDKSLAKGPYAWTIAAKVRVLSKLNRKNEAQALLDNLEKMADSTYVSPYAVATDYGQLGRNEDAFRYLERAISEKSEDAVFLKIDPRFDCLRNDPRFLGLLRRIGFPS